MDESGWNFAKVNGKLAEVFFKRRGKVIVFQAFCYVKKSEYRTKKEQNWIMLDTENVNLKWRDGKVVWLNKPDWAIVRTGKIIK